MAARTSPDSARIDTNADGIVEQRRVQLGQTVGEMRVVESGLKPDERVVVNGLQRVRPGAVVAPQQVPMTVAAAAAAGPNGTRTN